MKLNVIESGVLMEKHPFRFRLARAFGICIAVGLVLPVYAQDTEPAPDLPGYYEFFLKTGKLTQLKSEAKRDEAIQTGDLKALAVNEPVQDLKLPDAFNVMHGTRAHVGQKNLVMITGRAWW